MLKRSLHLLIYLATISLIMAGCAAGVSDIQSESPAETDTPADASPVDLKNILWQLEQYADSQGTLEQTLPGTLVTAEFKADKLSGNAGCNSYSGSYETKEKSIVIGPLASTMMFCPQPDGVMDQESAYLAALGSATSYRIQGDRLIIHDSQEHKTLVYQSMPNSSSTQLNKPSEPLDEKAIMNAEYASEYTASGSVRLVDGEHSEPAAPGSASQLSIQITTISYGTLADGRPAAAVVHATNTGGSGSFFVLSLVSEVGGEPTEIAATPLGDRIVLNAISWDAGEVLLDLTAHASDDAMCCPTQHEMRRFSLVNDELVEIERQVVKTPEASPPTSKKTELVGVTWHWLQFQEMDDSLTIPDDPSKYTLEFHPDSGLNILADCNGGSGAYTADRSQLSIQIRRMTMAACPPGSLSDEYVRLLNDAVSYQFKDGDLYIAIKYDTGIMQFTPASNSTHRRYAGA